VNGLDALLNEAREAYRSGRPADAEQLAGRILEQASDHPAALYLMGMLRLASGEGAEAVEWLGRAVAADPGAAPVRLAFGMALWSSARCEEGLAEVERAAALAPNDPSTAAHLAALYLQSGRNEEAYQACLRSVDLAPAWPAGQRSLGVAARAVGRMDQAIAALRRATELDPTDAEAATYLADTLQKSRQPREAAIEWERAARLHPDDPTLWGRLGAALQEAGDAEGAAEAYGRALLLLPEDEALLNSRAAALKSLGRLDEAKSCMLRALEIDPGSGAAHGNLGVLLYEAGWFEEALEHFETAAAAQPASHVARYHLWNAQLLLGDYEQGWRNFDWWMDRSLYNARHFVQPRWRGEPMPGGTLLVYSDHGFGDAVQMARFLPEARARARSRIVVECQPQLLRLFAASNLADAVVARRPDPGPPDIEFDARIGLMDLPALFHTTLETLPAPSPTIHVPEPVAAIWRDRIGEADGLRVGVRWQGNPGHPNDALRSCRLADLLPIARIPGVRLFSLQTDRAPAPASPSEANPTGVGSYSGSFPKDLDPSPKEPDLIDLAPELSDFLDTAAAIQALDLVITVDTAVAHVAGALARPTWVLLSAVPDWRWLLGRGDSPWYPGMRLFRQTTPGRWDDVIQSVAAALTTGAGRSG
jgi:tetratricopeptide (TPR) repeat protein